MREKEQYKNALEIACRRGNAGEVEALLLELQHRASTSKGVYRDDQQLAYLMYHLSQSVGYMATTHAQPYWTKMGATYLADVIEHPDMASLVDCYRYVRECWDTLQDSADTYYLIIALIESDCWS